jgi:drug/metabolite transporter (DMT)-like permease
MSITVILASSYMMVKKTKDFPFGAKGVRLLLFARGFGGFFGVFGMYYSLLYLPLADATVITFLSPVIACAACAILLKEEFSRMEQLAAFISLFGVVLIARPTAIFSYFQQPATGTGVTQSPATSMNNTTEDAPASLYREATSQQKVLAVAVGMVGVLGGATVITTLRWISNRAHVCLVPVPCSDIPPYFF